MKALSGITLGEVVSGTGGTIQTGPFGSQLHASDYVTNGTPVVMPINIGDNAIIHRGIATISDEDAKRLARHRLRPGDILFGRRGDIGRRSIVRSAERGWICGTGCLAVKFGANLSNVSPEYLALYVGSHACKDWLLDNAVGGTMPNLNSKILSSLPVALPPKSEQDAAVSSIAAVASLEDSLHVLVAKKRAIKQGMMQELMTGRTRLSGYTGLWRRVLFSDIVTPVSERVDPGRAIGRVVELEHLSQSTGELVGYSDVRSTESLKTSFQSGDVLFGKLRAYLRKFWLADFDGFCSTEIWALRPIPKVSDGAFIRYVVEEDAFIEAASTSYGTHMPRSDWRVVSKFELDLPPLDEQRAIAQVLRVADAEIEALEKRLEATRQIKEGMMQELLTGRTRLV